MNLTQLLHDIEQLPPEGQRQVENFIEFLKTRHQAKINTKLSDEGFVGMWSDRQDLQDNSKIDNPSGQDKTSNDQNTIKPAKTETPCSALKT